jgi:hypothetical protein
VKAHQDDDHPYNKLSRAARLNVDADRFATWYRDHKTTVDKPRTRDGRQHQYHTHSTHGQLLLEYTKPCQWLPGSPIHKGCARLGRCNVRQCRLAQLPTAFQGTTHYSTHLTHQAHSLLATRWHTTTTRRHNQRSTSFSLPNMSRHYRDSRPSLPLRPMTEPTPPSLPTCHQDHPPQASPSSASDTLEWLLVPVALIRAHHNSRSSHLTYHLSSRNCLCCNLRTV